MGLYQIVYNNGVVSDCICHNNCDNYRDHGMLRDNNDTPSYIYGVDTNCLRHCCTCTKQNNHLDSSTI